MKRTFTIECEGKVLTGVINFDEMLWDTNFYCVDYPYYGA